MLFETQSSCEQPTEHRSLTQTCGSQYNSYCSDRRAHGRSPGTGGMTDDAHQKRYNATDTYGSKPPRHPRFSLYADRIMTFTSWPTDMYQKPNDLAVAGFFYLGTADIVTCYSCGGSLKEWEPCDNPMIEHAHWFPSCDFLLQTKGENFIREAQLKSEEPSASTEKDEHYNVADAVVAGVDTRTQSSPLQNATSAEAMELLLTTPAALSVMMMGYSRDMVKQAIERCLISGKTKLPAQEIMKVILDMEEENETENVLSEAESEDVLKSECENEQIKCEKESNYINHNRTDSMYSQCTEEPSSGPNTMYTSSPGPNTLCTSPGPISTYASQERHHPVLDNFKSLSLQKESTPRAVSSSELHKMNDLAEENRMLKESSLCKVCLDKTSNTVFLPCGHLATCEECASSLRKCPLCRKHIHGTVKVYLA